MTTGEVITFFDIAVRLGVFARWQDACNDFSPQCWSGDQQ